MPLRKRYSGDTPEREPGDVPSACSPRFDVPVLIPVLIFALAVVGSAVGLTIASSFSGVRGVVSTSNLSAAELFGDLVGLWVVLLLGCYLCVRRWGTGNVWADLGVAIRPSDLVTGLIIGVGGQLLLVPVVYYLYQYLTGGSVRGLSAPAQNLVNAGQGGSVIMVGALIVLGAPIVEEIFFRGLVLRSILSSSRSLSPVWSNSVAVVGSAALFTLAHLEGLQSFGLFALGLILGLVALKSRRIGATIVAHASFNLVSFIALVHR